MDGACKGAIDLMATKFPWMSGVVCSTHALDLLMEDIGKMEWAENIVERARDTIHYINSHHFTKAKFSSNSRVVLKAPNTTRFGTNFLMGSRLLQCRGALRQTVCDRAYEEWVRGLDKADKKRVARCVTDAIRCTCAAAALLLCVLVVHVPRWLRAK
jgi:hypothetical protein